LITRDESFDGRIIIGPRSLAPRAFAAGRFVRRAVDGDALGRLREAGWNGGQAR
jgi:hypothetical protein